MKPRYLGKKEINKNIIKQKVLNSKKCIVNIK